MLEAEFAKDEISDMCEKIRKFMKLHKTKDQTIQQYISSFDQAYTSAQNSGLTALPDQYLMYMLLENSQMKDQDYRLVLTSIDLSKANTLYSQAKKSLIKFFGALKPSQHEAGDLKCEIENCEDHDPTFERSMC